MHWLYKTWVQEREAGDVLRWALRLMPRYSWYDRSHICEATEIQETDFPDKDHERLRCPGSRLELVANYKMLAMFWSTRWCWLFFPLSYSPLLQCSATPFLQQCQNGPEKFLREIKKMKILKGRDLFHATFLNENMQVNPFSYGEQLPKFCKGNLSRKKGKTAALKNLKPMHWLHSVWWGGSLYP